MSDESPEPPISDEAASQLGARDALRLLTNLVALAPTNLEDPPRHRYEKPRYTATVDRLARYARDLGLPTRIIDPMGDPAHSSVLEGGPRPNLIVDLDVGARERVLILAHYDVVPVPVEQRERWKTPPHVLTRRSDGRLYGRGANDDLGSGVVASYLALKRLTAGEPPRRNVRLLVCCDEETGGAGGIESLKEHDERLPPGDPGRVLVGDVALIPDGSPHTTAGSCGLAFLDAEFDRPVPLSAVLDYGEFLVALHDTVRRWMSRYPSPDWPDHGAPEPVLTGRATVTKFDLRAAGGSPGPGELVLARAETDAANQIAESVTLGFSSPAPGAPSILERIRSVVAAPYRVHEGATTSGEVPPGTQLLTIQGTGAHGGYPHRGHNPVPAAFAALRHGLAAGWIPSGGPVEATFSVDLRLTPEMSLDDGLPGVLTQVESWIRSSGLPAQIDAPPSRCRGGYCLAPDHPAVLRLDRLLRETVGSDGVFGEYGGTDASSLSGLTTPSGEPLPAIVFGSMDREANIHQAEESVDPRLLGGVARAIERFVREP
ncbi:MAG TPA: M20/M25/M40 family metallo-hydrolase [Thermoplasmata archaeon]|nr:M20/M25/M40 family metallo-hydrolase [Thermoplasmata archaeon]